MRILEQKKIAYAPHGYAHQDGPADAETVAALLGVEPWVVFKTLVTRGASGGHYVFVVPATGELDLKKAAKAAGEKSLALLPLKDLTPLTGYVRGGCSPVGMKKRLPTVIHESALGEETIFVSAGRVGAQVELAPRDLAAAAGAEFADIVKEAP